LGGVFSSRRTASSNGFRSTVSASLGNLSIRFKPIFFTVLAHSNWLDRSNFTRNDFRTNGVNPTTPLAVWREKLSLQFIPAILGALRLHHRPKRIGFQNGNRGDTQVSSIFRPNNNFPPVDIPICIMINGFNQNKQMRVDPIISYTVKRNPVNRVSL